MKKKSSIYFTLLVFALSVFLVLLLQNAFSQTYVPITNYHNGISIGIQGTQGSDYVFDRYYFDPLINDCGLCYIKSDVDITLAHNSNNSRFINNQTIITGGDAGDIRIKIDRDWQISYWAGDNGVPHPDWTHEPERFLIDGPFHYPYYPGPFSFDDMEYETGVPVVGTTGLKPGVPLSMDENDRENLYSRGLLDLAGNEYHYLTYADDDDQDPQWKNLEYSASDGKSMLFCVNPKTPAIWLTAATSGAQYYTTPGKVNWIPKFHEQISYVMADVNIQLKNIMNSNPVYYRIDGGAYSQYSGPISSNTLTNGEHTLEFYYDPTYVQTRKIIKNPDHPCKQDVFEDGKGHGYLFWKDDADLQRFRDRCLTGVWSNNQYYTRGYHQFKSDFLDGNLNWPGNQGIRNPDLDRTRSDAFMYAVVGVVEGVTGNEAYMDQAKVRLMNNQRMHIEHIGLPLQTTQDANPSYALVYRGYYTDWVLYNNAFIYDILAKYYRSDQFSGGMTPIEDLRIRDMMAQLPHECLMTMGGYRTSTVKNPDDINDVMAFTGMQVLSHSNAAFITSLAMPSYNTSYYGTSGFDGTQASNTWAPYPDDPQSWKDVFYTYTNYQDPTHLAQVSDFPNRMLFYNWYDGTITSGMIRADGNWDTKPGYIDVLLCGHGMEIFYNVVRRRLDMSFQKLDLFMQKSLDGTVWCYGESTYATKPRRMMANEYFPELAPIAIDAHDSEEKYFYQSNGYYLIFHNPDWASVSQVPVTTVSVSPSIVNISPDESVNLRANLLPIDASKKWVTWSSSDTTIATVNTAGYVVGIANGTCTITVTTIDGGFTADCAVTVSGSGSSGNLALNKPVIVDSHYNEQDYPKENAVDGNNSDNTSRWISANSPYPHYIEIDLEQNCEVTEVNFWTGNYSYGYPVYDYQIQQWNGSSWVDIINVTGNSSGEVSHTFPAITTSKIRLLCNDGLDNIVRLYEIEVIGTVASSSTPVESVSVSPTSLTLDEGQTSDLTETVTPSNATNQNVTWSTSNPSVATVDSNGLITAVAAGNATITVTTVDGGFTADCALTVNATGGLSNLALNKPVSSDSELSGYPDNLAVDGNHTDNASRWISEGTSYPHWIEVDLQGNYDISLVKFWTGRYSTPYPIHDFEIRYWDGTAWQTSETITGNASGEVTVTISPIVTTNKVMLYCTAGQDNYVRLFEIEVWGEAPSTIAVTDVSVAPSTLNLDVGESSDLTETITPSNATDPTVTWSSSNTSIATVDSNGLVEAVSAGSCTITATANDGSGFSDDCSVTVNQAVTGVSVSPSSLSLDEGQTSDLTETISPANATDPTVSWSSSNTSIATVDANGLVTAVTAGTCTITVTTNDGGFIDNCTVNVFSTVLENLAYNQPVISDSEYNASYPAENAVDGDNSSNASRWITTNTAYPHWIEIDLEQTCNVTGVNFWTGYYSYRYPIYDYQIQQWDGSSWVDILNITGNSNAEVSHTFSAVSTNKIRLYCTAGQDNMVRLFEIEVWGYARSYKSKEIVTGIQEDNFNAQPGMLIYPNPTSSRLISFTTTGFENGEFINVQLFDLSGRVLYNSNFSSDHTSIYTITPKTELNSGIYILQLNTTNYITRQKFIIK